MMREVHDVHFQEFASEKEKYIWININKFVSKNNKYTESDNKNQ